MGATSCSVCMYAYLRVYIHVDLCVCTYIHIYDNGSYILLGLYVCIFTCVYVCIFMPQQNWDNKNREILVYMYIRMYVVYIHIYMHIHVHMAERLTYIPYGKLYTYIHAHRLTYIPDDKLHTCIHSYMHTD